MTLGTFFTRGKQRTDDSKPVGFFGLFLNTAKYPNWTTCLSIFFLSVDNCWGIHLSAVKLNWVVTRMECNSLPEFHRFELKKKKAFDSVCQGKFMADQKKLWYSSEECISFVTVLQGLQMQRQTQVSRLVWCLYLWCKAGMWDVRVQLLITAFDWVIYWVTGNG